MKKRVLIILCISFFVILCLEVKNTYSLFETNGSAVVDKNLANWQIKVNNTYLNTLSEDKKTFSLGSILWDSKNHVKEGKAAPGSVGMFYIEIDPTATEVSFLYEITFDTSSLNNSEFEISSVREVNGKQFIRISENTYVGIVPLREIKTNTKYKVKVDVTWNNNDDNNEADYELGSKADLEIDIPVSVTARQYDGSETFTEYDEDSV